MKVSWYGNRLVISNRQIKGKSVRHYLLAAVAAAAITSPALARDGQPYVGIEGGILFPKDQNGDIFADFTTTQLQPSPLATGPVDANFGNAVRLDYKRGSDIDMIAGFDFGMFRIEGEFARKRARLDSFEVDAAFLSALNVALNRPSVAPDIGAPGGAAVTAGDLDLDGRVKVRSIMANALLDFGDENGLSFYAGAGIGRARVELLRERDNALAVQGIAGVRYAISPNIDIGLKYRYFRTGNLDLSESFAAGGNLDRTTVNPVGPIVVDTRTTVVLFTDLEQKFRSHSLLASLIFNFGGAAPPPPPRLSPLPPPPPATQTCPDGSVVRATDICPALPVYVPPPPPPPMGERG